MNIIKANISDASAILALQKLAYESEAKIYNDFSIAPLTQTLTQTQNQFSAYTFLKLEEGSDIIASIRAYEKDNVCFIEKLIVHPLKQNQGFGTAMMNEIEAYFSKVKCFQLFTGIKSKSNIYLYKKLGYSIFKTEVVSKNVELVYMKKSNSLFS